MKHIIYHSLKAMEFYNYYLADRFPEAPMLVLAFQWRGDAYASAAIQVAKLLYVTPTQK
jgi:hypothetical protein